MNSAKQRDWRLCEIAPVEPGIVCIDIEQMIRFYTDVLGLRMINDVETSPERSSKFGAAPDGYRIVRLQTAMGQKLKLVQPKTPPSRNPLPEWVFQRQGIAYLTFVVADIRDVTARLKACGVRTVSYEPVEIRERIVAIFTLDPENNYVEFVETLAKEERK